MKHRPSQREFGFMGWGGKRRGAGRKPKGERAGVSHAKRPKLGKEQPVFVTLKLAKHLPSLRNDAAHAAIAACFAQASRSGFQVSEYSLQRDHVHCIVEAEDRRTLSRGMLRLAAGIAGALNKLWKRCGQVFPDRYHARILKTPREVRNALVYLLQNAKKHGALAKHKLDEFSSALSFDGWKGGVHDLAESSARFVGRARTWLLRVGWRRHGLIDPSECPRSG